MKENGILPENGCQLLGRFGETFYGRTENEIFLADADNICFTRKHPFTH